MNPYRYGDVIDGRYRVREPLGQGGMGSVYIAEHINFRRRVALKVLLGSGAADRVARERFVTEARAVCHLQHPNLVTYHDFGTDPKTGHLYLVMELLEGKSLAGVLRREKPLPTTRVLHIMAQLCDALCVAHGAGVIHRDLKPGNVMVVHRGQDPDFVKLIDFGIVRVMEGRGGRDRARRSRSRPLTEAGMVIGTGAYLAPEYITHQIVDERTDIYALGIMCYELIAGHRPFQHKLGLEVMKMHLTMAPRPLTALQDGREVPELVNRAVMAALEKDPGKRIGSVVRFKAQLLAAAAPLMDDEAVVQTQKAPGLFYGDQRGTELQAVDAVVGEAQVDERPPTRPIVRRHISAPRLSTAELGNAPTADRTGPSTAGNPATGSGAQPALARARWPMALGMLLAGVAVAGTTWWLSQRYGPTERSPAQSPASAVATDGVERSVSRASSKTGTTTGAAETPVQEEPGTSPHRSPVVGEADHPARVAAAVFAERTVTRRVAEWDAASRGRSRRGPERAVVNVAGAIRRPRARKAHATAPGPSAPSGGKAELKGGAVAAQPKMGRARVVAIPYGTIFRGGKALGKDLLNGIPVPLGRQCFRASNPVHGSKTVCREVRPGKTTRITIKLQ